MNSNTVDSIDVYIGIDVAKEGSDKSVYWNDCDFKSNIEIMHYDDTSSDIKSQIHLNEFGNDMGYIADCVVINFRNGNPKVSYYANLSDFTSHPKWDDKNCFVVCFHDQYKRQDTSETK